MRRTRTLNGLASIVVAAGMSAGSFVSPASASPPSGVTPTTYVTADLADSTEVNHDRIKLQTKDPATVRVQKLEFAPGGYTGFHYHPGAVIVSVQSGSLTLVDGGTCATETYGAGSVFVEGEDHVHQAVSADGAVVYVTYIVPRDYSPANEKYRVEAPVPFCATHL